MHAKLFHNDLSRGDIVHCVEKSTYQARGNKTLLASDMSSGDQRQNACVGFLSLAYTKMASSRPVDGYC